MKKYTFVLGALTLSLIFFSLLGFTSGASAFDTSDTAGCTATSNFSTTTGKPCGNTVTECAVGDKFGSVTGRPCDRGNEGGGQGGGGMCKIMLPRDFKIGSRGDDVKAFQQSLKDQGFLFGKVDGVYGQITDGARANYYKKCPPPSTSDSLNVFPSGSTYVQGEGASIPVSWSVSATSLPSMSIASVSATLLTKDGKEVLGNLSNTTDCSSGGDAGDSLLTNSYKWNGLVTCSNWQVHTVNPGIYKIGIQAYSGNTIVASGKSKEPITLTSSTSTGAPVISSVDGPQTLNINLTGVWTVKASDSSGGNLSYSVVWQDESGDMSAGHLNSIPSSTQQSATFTHTYALAGNYSPRFYVKNSSGQSNWTSLSVKVGDATPSYKLSVSPTSGKAPLTVTATYDGCSPYLTWGDGTNLEGGGYGMQTCGGGIPYSSHPILYKTHTYTAGGVYTISLYGGTGTSNPPLATATVNVSGTTPTSSLSVLSPNGGETWNIATTQSITWKDKMDCPTDAYCASLVNKHYDIKLVPNQSCPSGVVCTMLYRMPYTIANSVAGYSFSWYVGKTWGEKGDVIPSGSYTIKVCQAGTDVCDSSDSPFSIAAAAMTN